MNLDTGFRVSAHLTLALACACLCHAEEFFLPGILYMLGPILALIAGAFILERRWELTIRGSNLVGALIAAGLGVYLGYLVFFGGIGPHRQALPLPIGMLPYLGPVLIVLMLAWLFRPKKAWDYWALQGLGLVIVAVACALSDEIVFGILLFAYLASGIWHLHLFQLHRGWKAAEESLACASSDAAQPAREHGPPARIPWRLLGLWQTGWCIPVLLLIALTMFFVTPRHGNSSWQFGMGPPTGMRTGMGDGAMDLTRTGKIKVTNDVAFYVDVEDENGQHNLPLDPDQRFRCITLAYYRDGKWPRPRLYNPPIVEVNSIAEVRPGQSVLTYHLRASRRPPGLPLAEPLHDTDKPGTFIKPMWPNASRSALFQVMDGTLVCTQPPPDGRYRYQQICDPVTEPRLGPRVDKALVPAVTARLVQMVLTLPPGIRVYTEELLVDLQSQSILSSQDLKRDDSGSILLENREKVARALEKHLKSSGKFQYSLDLRRQDSDMDPIEDFLVHVKEGHCERFASALVLMLRSVGIPVRIVTGYMGAELHGNGRYLVRQSGAHAWAEVLIKDPGAREPEWYWLTLDPTPAQTSVSAAAFSLQGWSLDFLQSLGLFWKDYIADFNADRQRESSAELVDFFSHEDSADPQATGEGSGWLSRPWVWLALIGLPGCLFLFWLLRRRSAKRRTGLMPAMAVLPATFYGRLLFILKRHCELRPQLGQTPREFGMTAEGHLQRVPATAPCAEVPGNVVSLHYRVRFGHYPLTDEEQRVVNQSIEQLNETLQKANATATK